MGRNCDKVNVGLKKRAMLRITLLLPSWMIGYTCKLGNVEEEPGYEKKDTFRDGQIRV